jgi:hypothetical protein
MRVLLAPISAAYASTTTLAAIRAAHPCEDGWRKLLGHLGKTAADDESLPLLTVLDSNGLDDALWVLSKAMPDDRLARHFGAWCAEQVLHLFEAERPEDMRPRLAIAVARDDDATEEQRAAAWAAAWDAARDAAWAAARAAARAAAGAAAWAAAGDAARAAEAAARAAEAAAGDAEAAQEKQLRIMLAE